MVARPRFLTLLALLVGCGSAGRDTGCGIAALAGPGLLLDEFNRPGRTLREGPEGMPETLVVRFAAGDAFRAVVGRSDSGWIVGVEGEIPPPPSPGFGVLVVDPATGPSGVVVFDGPPIPGAPILGTVNAGAANLPLLGLQVPAAGFQAARCPLFPDSLLR
jgi:hypothetical protein